MDTRTIAGVGLIGVALYLFVRPAAAAATGVATAGQGGLVNCPGAPGCPGSLYDCPGGPGCPGNGLDDLDPFDTMTDPATGQTCSISGDPSSPYPPCMIEI